MPLYLSADGGGTKLQVLVYDEQMRLFGRGQSGGTNTNFTKPETVQAHMEQALDQALAGCTEIDTAYITIVGPGHLFESLLRERVVVKRAIFHGEALAYLLAGALTDTGCVALAGTGSGAAYISPEASVHFGGYGSVIGDDGSGWWIGSNGINAVIRAHEHWGEPTALHEALLDYLQMDSMRQLASRIYGQARDARSIAAGFCPYVGKAADTGDAVALRIIRQAAELLAMQMIGIFRGLSLPETVPVVCCGGVWKATPLLLEQFTACFRREYKNPIFRGRYNPVLHGPVATLLESGKKPENFLTELERFNK